MTDPTQAPSNQWGIDEAFKTLELLTGNSPSANGAMSFLRSVIERSAHEPLSAPMKLLFDNDWLRQHAETDPNDEPTAGGPVGPSRKELIDEIWRLSNEVAELKGHVRMFEQRASQPPLLVPIPMILICPSCSTLHVDEPDERTPGWTNPPHKSHLCHACGTIWRPADLPTVGVAAIETKGKADTWTAGETGARTWGDDKKLLDELFEATEGCVNCCVKFHQLRRRATATKEGNTP